MYCCLPSQVWLNKRLASRSAVSKGGSQSDSSDAAPLSFLPLRLPAHPANVTSVYSQILKAPRISQAVECVRIICVSAFTRLCFPANIVE